MTATRKDRDTFCAPHRMAHALAVIAIAFSACSKSNTAGLLDGGQHDAGPGHPGGDGGAPVFPDASGCGLRTCQSVHATCGEIGDGCGGLLYCGDCTGVQSCGGGGQANTCGGTHGCRHRTCAEIGANCGPVSDTCGGLLQCGTCSGNQTCGGGGQANVCGGNNGGGPGHDGGQPMMTVCMPRTCAQVGANCGPIGDGCGGTVMCGSCMAPDICGGGGQPSVCGGGSSADAGVQCTNLCQRQMQCPNGGTTSISGTVVAPTPPQYGNPDPLYGALVYVPNGPVEAFTPGVSCDRCGAKASGAPLVTAVTGPDGRFTILNAPTGANVPLVVQLGRWRRQVVIPNVNACTDNPLPADLTRLPRNKMEGDIPLMAMVTGKVDTLECVLRKIGIDDAEFTVPTENQGTGRVQIYVANGADIGGNTPNESDLWSTDQRLAEYDLVLFACEGSQIDEMPATQGRVINYANHGGRVFATHYSYVWLYNVSPWDTTGTWHVDTRTQHPPGESITAIIDTSFPKGMAFSQWASAVGAASAPDRITINVSRHDLDMPITAPAQRFIYTDSSVGCTTMGMTTPCPSTVQHYAFNTPWGMPPDQQCGRVIFSDFHVNNIMSSTGQTYPAECTQGPMTAQEKILEFMLFDLASCIQPDNPNGGMATCTKQTCAQAGANCGPVADGCGGLLQCGMCPMGQACGVGGTPSVCSPTNGGPGGPGGPCVPRSCADQGLHCGPAGDGCGNQIDCGSCPDPLTCGGDGTPGACSMSSCVRTTCQAQGATCGLIGDGCGGSLDCGTCHAPETCGGRGIPNVCGTPF